MLLKGGHWPLRLEESAGYDLFLPTNYEFFPKKTVKIDLCIRIAIPKGCFGQILNKSSISSNFDLIVLGGVIDSDYRGNLYVCVRNIGKNIIMLPERCAIAQLVIQEHKSPTFKLVDKFSTCTVRAGKGFGSSTPYEVKKKMKKYSVEEYAKKELAPAIEMKAFGSEDEGDYDLNMYEREKRARREGSPSFIA